MVNIVTLLLKFNVQKIRCLLIVLQVILPFKQPNCIDIFIICVI